MSAASTAAEPGGASRGADKISVRGVEAANILPAGVRRKRQNLQRPRDNGAADSSGASKGLRTPGKGLLPPSCEQNPSDTHRAEFRPYPFPPPAHPIAYPASEPAPDPRFYRSPFEDAEEAERKRSALPLRHRLVRRFESECGPLAPPKKRVSSTNLAVAAASAAAASIETASRTRSAPSIDSPAAAAPPSVPHLLDADGNPYSMSKRAPTWPAHITPSLPQRGRPRKRPAPGPPSSAQVPVPSKRRPTARHVDAHAWWKRPHPAVTPGPTRQRDRPVRSMQFSNEPHAPLPAPEAMPALPPLPLLPAISSRTAPADGKGVATGKRPRASSANPSEPAAWSRSYGPALSKEDYGTTGKPQSGHGVTIKGMRSPSFYSAPGSTVSPQATPPVLSSIPELPSHVGRMDVDANGTAPHSQQFRPSRALQSTALDQCSMLNAAMFAPMNVAVSHGALMNKAMFGAPVGGSGVISEKNVETSYSLQRSIDALRIESEVMWKEEMANLRKVAVKSIDKALERGEFLDYPSRRRVCVRLRGATKDTQALVRRMLDGCAEEKAFYRRSDVTICEEYLSRVMQLGRVALMMVILLLNLEDQPTDAYWKARKKQKLLIKRIAKYSRELNRIASDTSCVPPAAYSVPSRAAASRLPSQSSRV